MINRHTARAFEAHQMKLISHAVVFLFDFKLLLFVEMHI